MRVGREREIAIFGEEEAEAKMLGPGGAGGPQRAAGTFELGRAALFPEQSDTIHVGVAEGGTRSLENVIAAEVVEQTGAVVAAVSLTLIHGQTVGVVAAVVK
jgi:hypothetical protein